MVDALIHFGFFVAQTLVIIAAILIIFGGILAIATKGKLKGKTKIKIRKLNEYYDELAEKMQEAILNKKEKKELAIAHKKTKKQNKKKTEPKQKKRVYVINFIGDLRATTVNSLREEVSAILTVAKPEDEVFVKLESAGGVVHGYGLAASELQRIKNRNIPLTISVDKVAASGGYMMACVADRILSAPFAIIGSIGVVAQLPNFNRLLKKHNVEFEQITAGEYKRTLTLFGENTKKGREKMQDDVNDIHELFKEFIQTHRPHLDLEKVATGEHWFGSRALDLMLVDELITSDDYLMNASQEALLFEVSYKKKKNVFEKFTESAHALLYKNNLI